MGSSGKTNRILITGGAGFIGSHLAEALLEREERILIVDNFNDYYSPDRKERNIKLLESKASAGQLEIVRGDIRDFALVEEVFNRYTFSHVYHLAAMAGVRYSIQHPAIYFSVNVEGTVNLLKCISRKGLPKLIFASSSSVYGGSTTIPFLEDDPVNRPISPYAASKKAGELACHTFHHLFGLDVTCLRFFTVYGPRQRPEMAIHLFTDKMHKGEAIPMFGDGSTSRDYTFIYDIVSGILKAGEHCNGYNIYNLGNNKTVTLRDLIQTLSGVTGLKPVIDQQPLPPGDVVRTWADISKAEREIGYSPDTPIEAGLQKFHDWYLEYNSPGR